MAMRRLICCLMFVISALSVIIADAQNTEYYKLYKIEEHGKTISKCDGGQFIKISKNICYDVDSDGNDVGNGKLYREVNNNTINNIYLGDSYHGKARYIFSTDYSNLIVEINPHYKYFYRKSPIHQGVFTCSLIKRNSINGSSNSVDVNINAQWNSNQGISNSNNNNFQRNDVNNNSNSSTSPVQRKFKCAYCNGTGRIEKNDNAPASFGLEKSKKQCPECGKWYDPSVFVHYHIECRHCGGTGLMK